MASGCTARDPPGALPWRDAEGLGLGRPAVSDIVSNPSWGLEGSKDLRIVPGKSDCRTPQRPLGAFSRDGWSEKPERSRGCRLLWARPSASRLVEVPPVSGLCCLSFLPLVSPSSPSRPAPPQGCPWLGAEPLCPFPPVGCHCACCVPGTLAIWLGGATSARPLWWPPHLAGACAEEAPSVC